MTTLPKHSGTYLPQIMGINLSAEGGEFNHAKQNKRKLYTKCRKVRLAAWAASAAQLRLQASTTIGHVHFLCEALPACILTAPFPFVCLRLQ